MSAPSETDRSSAVEGSSRPPGVGPLVRVDRVACTGHGICTQLLTGVSLDEWGYPVVSDQPVDARDALVAVRLCPARALWVQSGPTTQPSV